MVDRVDPNMVADELVTLVEFLDFYRATLLLKVEGLSDDQARRTFVGEDAPPIFSRDRLT